MKLKLIANGSYLWERWIKRWGLSFLIDDDILFDAFGDARVLMGNLRRFRFNIGKIQQVVVSHEHWDHVDGLRPLLMERPGLDVYMPVGADAETKTKIRLWGGRIIDVSGPVEIKDGIYSSGEIVGKYDGKDMPEQAVVIKVAKGAVVITGCAHPGIAEMVFQVKKRFGVPVNGVIGGFHLKEHSFEDIDSEVARMRSAGVEMVAPLHCTGARAEKVFQHVFKSDCLLIREGQEINTGNICFHMETI